MTADIATLPPRDPFFALAPELRLHLSEIDGALVVNSREVARVFFHRKHRRVLRRCLCLNVHRVVEMAMKEMWVIWCMWPDGYSRYLEELDTRRSSHSRRGVRPRSLPANGK